MSLKESILKEYENGNFVYWNKDGKQVTSFNEVSQLDIDELLALLNRTEDKILSIANDDTKVKWVNDYALMKYVKSLYEKLSSSVVSCIELQSEIESLKNDANKYADNSSEIDELKETIASYQKKVESLTKEIESVKTQDADKNETLHETKQENIRLSEKNKGYAEKIDELTATITKLNDEKQRIVTAAKEMRAKYDSSIDEGNAKYNALKEELEKNNGILQEYANKLEKYDGEYAALVKEVTSLKETNKENSKYRSAYDNLKKQNDELVEQNNLLKEYTSSLENEVKTYMNNLSKMSTYVNDLTNRAVPSRPKELKRMGDNLVSGYNIGV